MINGSLNVWGITASIKSLEGSGLSIKFLYSSAVDLTAPFGAVNALLPNSNISSPNFEYDLTASPGVPGLIL